MGSLTVDLPCYAPSPRMSEPETRPRARRKHHKVATGCTNCKRRRVKCDEAENGCLRCQKANLFCPGYNPPRARIFESSSRSETHCSDNDVSSIVQTQRSSPFPLTLEQGINLGFVWQTAFLDSFLNTWLPHSLVRDYTGGKENAFMVPMSGWPTVTWKLAKRKDKSFVAHVLLCLTLCVIGSQTGDISLVAEATRHYARVLHQFQAQVRLLATSGYSTKQDDHVASLAAAGFCCSQVEYILQSWTNGDRHLQGMASLLEACGPACLKHDDTRDIFYDHYLLWNSCAITHRKMCIYSQAPWIGSGWFDLPHPCKTLLETACHVPPMLEEFDLRREDGTLTQAHGLLERLVDVTVQMMHLGSAQHSRCHPIPGSASNATSLNSNSPCEVSDDSFLSIVIAGYCSAFVHHTGLAAWELLRLQAEEKGDPDYSPVISGITFTHEYLQGNCEQYLKQLCEAIEELANERFSMIAASPLLFLLDSAWMGYRALNDFCGQGIDAARPWFERVGSHVTKLGYRPLREPWRKTAGDSMEGLMPQRGVASV